MWSYDGLRNELMAARINRDPASITKPAIAVALAIVLSLAELGLLENITSRPLADSSRPKILAVASNPINSFINDHLL